MIKQYLKVVFLTYCVLLLSTFSTAFAQSNVNAVVVGEVNDKQISFQELIDRYSTGISEAPTLDDLKNFLGIYTEYLLKLQFAYDRDYQNDPALIAEFNEYAKKAAYSYLIDKKIKPTEFDKYYERALKEVKSSHILIEIVNNDTTSAYKKIIQAREEWLSAGSSFDSLNAKYSSRKNGRLMGGELPWVTVGTTVAEFENQLFTLKEGEISQPFKTQFGYHVLKVHDIRERAPLRMASHIFQPNTSNAKSILDEAYTELVDGILWKDAVKKYSADKPSVTNDGYIGWVTNGKFRPDFVNQINQIDPSLPFSEPVQTAYGLHIIKIDSVQTFTSEEHRRNVLMQEFLDSNNFSKSNEYVANWLIANQYAEVNYSKIETLIESIKSLPSNTLSELPTNKFNSDTIFSFNNHSYSALDFRDYLVQEFGTIEGKNFNTKILDKFYGSIVDRHIVDFTRDMFNEFNKDLANYKEGLIVYKVNDEELWSAATVDSSKLKQLFKKNKQDYKYPIRYHYTLISAINDSTLRVARKKIFSGIQLDSLRSVIPELAISSDSTSIISEEPLNRLTNMKKGEVSSTFKFRNRPTLLIYHNKLEAREMTFEEAFPRLLGEYQPERERTWLIETEKKYPVKIFVKNLEKAFQGYKKGRL